MHGNESENTVACPRPFIVGIMMRIARIVPVGLYGHFFREPNFSNSGILMILWSDKHIRESGRQKVPLRPPVGSGAELQPPIFLCDFDAYSKHFEGLENTKLASNIEYTDSGVFGI